MNWRAYLRTLSSDITLHPAVDEDLLAKSEVALSVRFPEQLRSLLEQTNGVSGKYELPLVWSIERIVEDNLHVRSNAQFAELYMPFDSLLFFADAGNGDQFAFPIVGRSIRGSDVFAWDHENDSRSWVAPSLQTYLEWWLSGKLKL